LNRLLQICSILSELPAYCFILWHHSVQKSFVNISRQMNVSGHGILFLNRLISSPAKNMNLNSCRREPTSLLAMKASLNKIYGQLDCYIFTGVLYTLLRKTLLKKGCSSNSFPKTFSIKFPPDISYLENK